MCLPFFDLLPRIKVEDSKLHVVAGADEPVFPDNELGAPNGEVGDVEGLVEGGGLIIPQVDLAGVEGTEGPGLMGVDVDAEVR